MGYLIPIVIAIQIIVGVLSASGVSSVASKKILGEADTASSDQSTVTPDPQTTETNSQPSNAPDNNQSTNTTTSQTTPEPATSEIQNQIATETTTPEISTSPTVEETSPSQSPTETEITPTSEQDNNLGDKEHNSFQKDINSGIKSLDDALFHDVTENSPSDQISDHTVSEVKTEEEQLSNAKTPEEKIDLLSKSVNNNIASINTDLKNNQLDDLDFSSVRLSYQIDKAIDTIQNLKQTEANTAKNQINTLCKNTDFLLRSSQLIVSEDTEQVMEITRGKCFNLQP